ncbi:hypothetical protein D3C75_1111360 [compost metagenome]
MIHAESSWQNRPGSAFGQRVRAGTKSVPTHNLETGERKRPKSYENATCDPHGQEKWTHTDIVGHGHNHYYDFYTFFPSRTTVNAGHLPPVGWPDDNSCRGTETV